MAAINVFVLAPPATVIYLASVKAIPNLLIYSTAATVMAFLAFFFSAEFEPEKVLSNH
jgi:hypothetical protein